MGEHYHMGNVERKPALPARVIYLSGSACDARRMAKTRTVEQTRLANFRLLEGNEHGAITKMAKKLGKAQPQWQNTIGKTQTKAIGSKLAREVERAYGKDPGWADIPHDDDEAKPDEAQLGLRELDIAVKALFSSLAAKRQSEAVSLARSFRKRLTAADLAPGTGLSGLLSILEEGARLRRAR